MFLMLQTSKIKFKAKYQLWKVTHSKTLLQQNLKREGGMTTKKQVILKKKDETK